LIELCALNIILLLDHSELRYLRPLGLHEAGATFQLWQVRKSLLDPKTWFLAMLAATNSTILVSTGAFLPTIVKSFGCTALRAQLFTVIPYACAFISMIVIGILSDRYRNKGFFVLGSLSSCVLGLVILLTTTSKQAGLVGASFLVMGAYPVAVLQIAWTQISFCGYTKRAISWGVAMIFGTRIQYAWFPDLHESAQIH
jgi:MFS family permease